MWLYFAECLILRAVQQQGTVRVRVEVMIKFLVCLVSGYAHVLIVLSAVIVPYPLSSAVCKFAILGNNSEWMSEWRRRRIRQATNKLYGSEVCPSFNSDIRNRDSLSGDYVQDYRSEFMLHYIGDLVTLLCVARQPWHVTSCFEMTTLFNCGNVIQRVRRETVTTCNT